MKSPLQRPPVNATAYRVAKVPGSGPTYCNLNLVMLGPIGLRRYRVRVLPTAILIWQCWGL